MSQVLIQQYLNQLQDLRKVSGTHRESVVREAFKDLLKGWARSRALIFVPEYIEIRSRFAERPDNAPSSSTSPGSFSCPRQQRPYRDVVETRSKRR
jgi:hypothetical protein